MVPKRLSQFCVFLQFSQDKAGILLDYFGMLPCFHLFVFSRSCNFCPDKLVKVFFWKNQCQMFRHLTVGGKTFFCRFFSFDRRRGLHPMCDAVRHRFSFFIVKLYGVLFLMSGIFSCLCVRKIIRTIRFLFMICVFSFIGTAYCFAICSRKTLRVGYARSEPFFWTMLMISR